MDATMQPSRMRRVVKWIGWSVVALVVAAVLLALALLAINLRDRRPSEHALRAQALVDAQPPVADADNAHLMLSGFNAARDADPIALGRSLADAAQMQVAALRVDAAQADIALAPAIAWPIQACRGPEPACIAQFDANAAKIDALLDAEAWRLQRYRALLAMPGWAEWFPALVAGPMPQYSHAITAQQLHLLSAWRSANAGDADAVRDALQADVVFWRHALARSQSLISKMIAVAAIRRNFDSGAVVLSRLPPEAAGSARPASWSEPLTDDERAMHRVLAHEWAWSDSVLADGLAQGPGADPKHPQPESGGGKLRSSALYKPQDTRNRLAELLLTLADLHAVPIGEMPRAQEAARAYVQGMATPRIAPYNPVGRILGAIAAPSYVGYFARVNDLEGLRRVALLVADLHEAGATRADVARRVATSPLRDPYRDVPFAYDAVRACIAFEGLATTPKGAHCAPVLLAR